MSSVSGQMVTAYVAARAYFRNILGSKIYDPWTEDASYIRLREARLGYTFSRTAFPSFPFRSLNIAFIARNPSDDLAEGSEGRQSGGTGNRLVLAELAGNRSAGHCAFIRPKPDYFLLNSLPCEENS
ncbi:hypothetical protein ACQ86N_21675 [Puia sp. P3]|uniref:hypothetical protein n=1 Tax=Puia sp. P3 TaxID=3423952 RepID=UPI003D67B909